MSIDVVALQNVLQDVLIRLGHTLADELIVTTLGTYFSRCRDEDFQFGIREHRRTDVAAIHHDASFLPHGLLLSHHCRADKRHCSDRTDVIADFKRPDFLLDEFAVQVGIRLLRLRVELERDADFVHSCLELIGFHCSIGLEEIVAQCKQCHGTIHRTRVNIDVANLLGQILRHRALSTR